MQERKYYNSIEDIWKDYENEMLYNAPKDPAFRESLKQIFYDGAAAVINIVASINADDVPESAKEGIFNGVVLEVRDFQHKRQEQFKKEKK